MLRRESSAEWIASELDAVFRSHPRAAIDRALPLLVLMMARDFGLENLEPRIRNEALRVLEHLGIHDALPAEEANAKLAAFVEALAIDPALLRDIKQVFDVHYEALTETSARRFGKMARLEVRRSAPKVGEPRPANTIGGEDLLRRATHMIRS